MAIKLNQTD